MGIKKFISVFTVIIFIFLCISGFVLISYINSQEAKAIVEVNNPDATPNPNATPTPSGILNEWIDYPDAFNMLILVKDVKGYNTDAMMIVNYDPANKQIHTLSIPRDIIYDYYYSTDNETGDYIYVNGERVKIPIRISDIYIPEIDKSIVAALDATTIPEDATQKEINELNQQARIQGKTIGALNAISLFENHFNINIKYYVTIDLSIFREIINQLGGVDYNIPVKLDYDDAFQDLHIHFNPGMQHLDGQAAEELLRFRRPNNYEYTEELNKYYPTLGSDIDRINVQQEFFQELIRQKANFLYASKISSILYVVYDNIQTNIDMPAIIDLLKYIPEFDMNNIMWKTIPGEIDGDYYLMDYIQTRELIKKYFIGSSK
ncbi:MAG: LCP family protein [Clostridiales bacterium]|nr:LCP family protein [Clostridiales bacterium]